MLEGGKRGFLPQKCPGPPSGREVQGSTTAPQKPWIFHFTSREKKNHLWDKLEKLLDVSPHPKEATMYLPPEELFLILLHPPVKPSVLFRTCGCSCSYYRVLGNKVRPVPTLITAQFWPLRPPRPWGIRQSPNSGGKLQRQRQCMCVCVLCAYVFVVLAEVMPTALPWYFPRKKGLISERARGVLDHDLGNVGNVCLASVRLGNEYIEWHNTHTQYPDSDDRKEGR